MLGFSSIKINLGLNVVSKRGDGYHNLESVFLELPLGDVIELLPLNDSESTLQLQISGAGIEKLKGENIVENAWKLLKRDFDIPAVKVYLHKVIPSGAGLGGGSSDGVTMLKMLNEYFSLQLKEESLIRYALELGSDCPFFVKGGCSYVEGRGEILNSIEKDFSQLHFLVVHTGVHSSTRDAFSGLEPARPLLNVKEIVLNEKIEAWKYLLKNDFEKNIFNIYPELNAVKEEMYKGGCIYSSMSGSGSSVFGIFNERAEINFPENFFVRWCTISEPF